MSLVETVQAVPNLASPVRDKMSDYSVCSPFGLVPSPTDFLNWDAGSPFFHQTEIKAEPVSLFEACSPHSLHSPSPSPSAPPHSPPEVAENELLGIGGLSDFLDAAQCKAKSNPIRSHPYVRPVGYRSVPKEQSILHSVLSSKTTRSKPEYGSQHIGLGGEVNLDLQNNDCVGDGELKSGASSTDFMGDLYRLVWSSVESDSHQVSQRLNIPRNPYEWSRTDVIKWVSHVQEEQKLDPVLLLTSFSMTGRELLAMSEQDFRTRYPQGGSILYAKLEILRMYWEKQSSEPAEIPVVDIEDSEPYTAEDPFVLDSPDIALPLPVASPMMSSCYLSPQSDFSAHSPSTISSAPTPSPSYFGEMRDDDDEDEDSAQGGSHIHLWQFIKELLLHPEIHGSAIRWVSRDEGIFKIEDSVRVARLWGKRKNRPAMNYDKLSRSLRQYYKKGVMKKTERSQRLVYQFCDPYFK